MPHEVESMMYIGKVPWHGLGTAFPADKKLTVDEAIVAAGLNWEVELRPIFARNMNGTEQGISDYFASIRKSDNKVLGVVGKEYTPLQNKDAFKWFQQFLDLGTITIHTAGSLMEGKRVWVLARIENEKFDVSKDDIVENFILLSNSHDGTQSVRIGFTPIRVVCNNTLCLAHDSTISKLLKVKHTSGLIKTLDDIREILNTAHADFAATITQYKKLLAKDIDSEGLDLYVKKVFNLKDASRSKKIMPVIISSFEQGRSSEVAGKNYWGAYNAVNTYLNHFRSNDVNTRMDSLWFGEANELNKIALSTALEFAGVGK